MGFFGFIKKQLLKVIEWSDMGNDVLIKRFDCPDRYAIMKGSVLVVREGQTAVLVNEGKFADVFTPGTYKLEEIKNIPILSAIANWKYAFETKWQAEVYFMNTTQFNAQKWGTQNPVMMRDKDFGVIRVRAFGLYSFRGNDIEKVIKELVGNKAVVLTSAASEHIKRTIIGKLSDILGEANVPALDMASQYEELSDFAKQKLADTFANFGLEICTFAIENISLPPEVEKSLDTRTSMGIMSDKMGTFTQYQAAQAMRDAAQNPNGGLAGAGVGLGAGVGIGNMMANAFSQAKDTNNQDKTNMITCPKCGKEVKENVKFCPNCGEQMQKTFTCPKCGKEVKEGAKFCPNCGESLVKLCPKCNQPVKNGAKFCPSCGEKL